MSTLKEKLKREFSELVKVFGVGEEIKIDRFKEALEETMKFSEKLKDKYMYGNSQEKEELKEFIEEMKVQMEEEKNKLFQKIGISEEELKTFINNKENFSEEDWNTMQEMKNCLQDNVEAAANKAKKVNKSKTKWLQS